MDSPTNKAKHLNGCQEQEHPKKEELKVSLAHLSLRFHNSKPRNIPVPFSAAFRFRRRCQKMSFFNCISKEYSKENNIKYLENLFNSIREKSTESSRLRVKATFTVSLVDYCEWRNKSHQFHVSMLMDHSTDKRPKHVRSVLLIFSHLCSLMLANVVNKAN